MIREEQRIIALHFRHVTFQAAIDLPGSAKRVVVLLRIVTLHALPDSMCGLTGVRANENPAMENRDIWLIHLEAQP